MTRFTDGRTTSDDYSAFNEVWDRPEGGMHQYLYRFLTSPDATFQHIAVWTIVQLLDSGDPQLVSNIVSSNLLIPNISQLAQSQPSSPSSSNGTPRSHSPSYTTETGDGQGEIQLLARRILDHVNGEADMVPGSVAGSHMQAGSYVPGSSVASSVRDHEELRRSVRDAFGAPRR